MRLKSPMGDPVLCTGSVHWSVQYSVMLTGLSSKSTLGLSAMCINTEHRYLVLIVCMFCINNTIHVVVFILSCSMIIVELLDREAGLLVRLSYKNTTGAVLCTVCSVQWVLYSLQLQCCQAENQTKKSQN